MTGSAGELEANPRRLVWVDGRHDEGPDHPGSIRAGALAPGLHGSGSHVMVFVPAPRCEVAGGVRPSSGRLFRTTSVDGVQVVWLRTNSSDGAGWRHPLLDLSFLAGFLVTKARWGKPADIIGSSAHPVAAFGARLATRLRGARFFLGARPPGPSSAAVDSPPAAALPRGGSAGSSLPRRALASVAGNGSVRKLAASTPFVREVAWRFVAGEDLLAGLAVVRTLNAKGIKGTLSYVGTHVRSEDEAIAAADEAIGALRGLRSAGLDSDLSVKLTQIGLDLRPDLCRAHLRRVLDCARDVGTFVRIDMEESGCVEATIGLFEEMREGYGAEQVGIALQSYLRHRRDDLGRLIASGSRIRLVKGGYWEPAEVAYRAKRDVDGAFFADIDRLLREGCHPAIATRDPAAMDVARGIADVAGLAKNAFGFQMPYGVRSDLQDRLVCDGYVVRCYLPYGGHWYEYVLGCLRRVPGGMLQRARDRVVRDTRSRR